MFEIKKRDDYIARTIRFPADILDRLKKVSLEHGISLNELIIQSAEYALEHLKKDDENK